MALPLRFRLIHKITGLNFSDWAKQSDKFKYKDVKKLMPCINHDGNIYIVDFSDFYLYGTFLYPTDWEVQLATRKENGRWVYKPQEQDIYNVEVKEENGDWLIFTEQPISLNEAQTMVEKIEKNYSKIYAKYIKVEQH